LRKQTAFYFLEKISNYELHYRSTRKTDFR
jgi:hypothetical protein